MLTRRDWLRSSGAAAVGLSVLGRSAWAEAGGIVSQRHGGRPDRLLVVIELQGGNDGLNTLVPFTDDRYYRARPKLAIAAEDVVPLSETLGFHPALEPLKRHFGAGRLAAVSGVGLPQPNRSHFEARRIWHTAEIEEGSPDGWLGRLCDQQPGEFERAVYVGSGTAPEAVWSRRASMLSLTPDQPLRFAAAGSQPTATPEDLTGAIAARLAAARSDAQRLSEVDSSASGDFGTSQLGRSLARVATLIRGGLGGRLFVVRQPGYDTHSTQSRPHRRLLADYAAALGGFLTQLAASGDLDRVVVLTHSEFGRRVAENETAGTDHGTSGPVLLAGRVPVGQLGTPPDLGDLVDPHLNGGDLATTCDFRRLYATVLQSWLDVSPAAVVGEFEPLAELAAIWSQG